MTNKQMVLTNLQFINYMGQNINPCLKSKQLTLGVVRRLVKVGKLRDDLVTEYLEIEKIAKENERTEEEIKEEQVAFLNEPFKKDFEPISIGNLEDIKREVVKRDESLDTPENLVDVMDIIIDLIEFEIIK